MFWQIKIFSLGLVTILGLRGKFSLIREVKGFIWNSVGSSFLLLPKFLGLFGYYFLRMSSTLKNKENKENIFGSLCLFVLKM